MVNMGCVRPKAAFRDQARIDEESRLNREAREQFAALHPTREWQKAVRLSLEILSEFCAAIAALLGFGSASIRLKERDVKRGLGSGFADDPRALLQVIYKQTRWNAWAAGG